MLRIVVVHLFQWLKRLSSGLLSRGSQYSESRDFTRENDEGRWTFVSIAIILTLSLYCLAGLGYYAKVNVWDGFTQEQKANIAQAMVVSSQNL
ncbi:hypothetical protein [Pseudomonas viridiflava]|uniref:hypothetical protein n=1 Tax=Pseudomonas viridiflava TaxID=33069 RepID=UPI000F0682DF|nr:hypothetical protein [Pseudomonas viridiflava]MBD8187203.1 hypothetical protein [Pseudomonas viridiflava]MDY0935821.1 hypothetical protein [Pseudomonas viridiflava]MDY1012412.1 hypothetical protein [Pseudomonas viridiflava]TKJ60367.1 hypothetical protein PviCFBP13507_20500 [Pseudomonas viridiflava]TKK25336.1 hypothetical protein PviCFBP13515_16970 [Pseudomonas viridiflava]